MAPILGLNGAVWSGLCVMEKQATVALHCGPGASGSPHDWIGSCQVFMSQGEILFRPQHSPYGYPQLYGNAKRVCWSAIQGVSDV